MWEYPKYVPVAKKKENAIKQIEKMKKKNPNLAPIIIEGTKIAKTWWGIAWNKNLESYADYDSRVGRGRSYARNGYILDLQIASGLITALVQGSQRKPYQIQIRITTLSRKNWEYIVSECSHSIASIEELTEGRFPQALNMLFTQQNNGLFPKRNEIKFDCDCPDWTDMCKHIAAVLFGVGSRLDGDPTLFFQLRDIPFQDLLKKSIEEKMQNMLHNSNKKSRRALDDTDIEDIFGIHN